jgi:integrase
MFHCPTCGTDLLFEVSAINPVGKSLEDWINHLEAAGLSYAYISKLKSILKNHIGPYLGDRDVKAINSRLVFDFYSSLLQRGLASKTIKHILDTLRGLLNHLYNLDVLPKLPKFPRIKIIPRVKHWISLDTQNSILVHVEPKYYLFVLLLFETGMRPGEARALKCRDIDDNIITVERAFDERNNIKPTKTGKIYRYQISEALARLFKINYQAHLPEARLFLMSRSAIQQAWASACKTSGTSIPLYQASRHSKASQINADCERDRLSRLKDALQHESAATTIKYYTLGAKERI